MLINFFPGPDVAAAGCLQYCASGPRGTHMQSPEQPAEVIFIIVSIINIIIITFIIITRSLEPMMKWSHGPPPI